MSVNQKLQQISDALFPDYLSRYDAIEVICLATTDGFPVVHRIGRDMAFDADKMAAASSTLYSISNAVAQQILSKSFKITIIEAEQGNMAFIALVADNKDFVLAISASAALNVGQLRVIIHRVAGDLISAV